MIEKWWQHVFFSVYLFCCHHPLKSPVHRSFKGMGGSSGSTFAKLCCRFCVNRPVCMGCSGYDAILREELS